MTQTLNGTTDDQISVEEWLAIRKQAGLEIDPETAEVWKDKRYTIDPYGVYSDLTEEEKQIGSCYFARSPGSGVCVSFHDLPEATEAALWERINRGELNDYDVPF